MVATEHHTRRERRCSKETVEVPLMYHNEIESRVCKWSTNIQIAHHLPTNSKAPYIHKHSVGIKMKVVTTKEREFGSSHRL
mmetsp:Transcript_7629/g.18701  ORF Transcript_7629/g.18701 Transcript_7629/m.18701 type:complete len:81 (+) Transcript_7629:2366-2608(+)